MTKYTYLFLINILFTAIFYGCKDDDESEGNKEELVIEANAFVSNIMNANYYWNEEMPEIDYSKESDTQQYFYKLLSSEDDYSYISNNADEVLNMFNGIEEGKGWFYSFHKIKNRDIIIAKIEYVFRDTPAYRAGVKRGDEIYMVNGEYMNIDNYYNLFNMYSATYKAKRYNSASLNREDVAYQVNNEYIYQNTVAEYSIFDNNIGYLFYTNYYECDREYLDNVFAEFKAAGVKDLILDLRYNTGGYNSIMAHLCSLIAPESVIRDKSIIIWFEYNKKMSSLSAYSKENQADRFEDVVKNNLNLNRIVFITSNKTYSCSEATIIGLQPYMETYCIGKNTGGKNYTMAMYSPSYITNRQGKSMYSEDINNWLIVPIIARYRNNDGYTFDSEVGIEPNYYLDENLYEYEELGSPTEPLTAAAIEWLTTGEIGKNKSMQINDKIQLPNKNRKPLCIMK